MRISVFGLGYVGCVAAACLARDGHTVVGVDVNQDKVATIKTGGSPVREPGLDELIRRTVSAGRLHAVTDVQPAVHETTLSLICVGTPSRSNGDLNTGSVTSVGREIGRALAPVQHHHTVVVRSTVLPGTIEETLIPAIEEVAGKVAGADFGVAMNPEFLREGIAIQDYDDPQQILIGEGDTRSGDSTAALYERHHAPIVRTSIRTAEMVKYANNAFHAVKVSFANEIGNLSKAHGLDGREVMELLARDTRLNISPAYLKPGFAFAGSCLPKDLRALLYRAKERALAAPVLAAALTSNQQQIEHGIRLVERTGRRKIGVLGLSFKTGTDDVRESPAVPLIETLVGRGYDVAVHDPCVDVDQLVGANRSYLEREIPHIASLMRPSLEEIVNECEVLVVTTPAPAYELMLRLVRADQIVVDLAGLLDGEAITEGTYEGISW